MSTALVPTHSHLQPSVAKRDKAEKCYNHHKMRIGESVIGVLSDTHGRMRESALVKLTDCELIIHAGDIGNMAILDQLRRVATVVAVKGNIDHGCWSADLNETEYIDFHENRILVVHNIEDLKMHSTSLEFDVLIYGHSHRASIQYKNGVLYLNPGSAGPNRFNLPASIAYLRLVEGRLIPEILSIEEN